MAGKHGPGTTGQRPLHSDNTACTTSVADRPSACKERSPMPLSPAPMTWPAPVRPAAQMGCVPRSATSATGASGAAFPLCTIAVPCQLCRCSAARGTSQCTAGCSASHSSTSCACRHSPTFIQGFYFIKPLKLNSEMYTQIRFPCPALSRTGFRGQSENQPRDDSSGRPLLSGFCSS